MKNLCNSCNNKKECIEQRIIKEKDKITDCDFYKDNTL